MLKVGYAADLFLIDTDKPYMHPAHDMLANLVYSAQGSDVVLTMCDGKILYENGVYKTIDVEKARYETEHRAYAIASKIGG